MVLDGTKPPIWRRILIDDSFTFADLHSVIQILMNWENCHLHDFDLGDDIKLMSDHDSLLDFKRNPIGSYKYFDATRVPLKNHLKKEGQTFLYTYDFGDNWGIVIKVEAIVPKQPNDKRVCCLAGKRNAPPEDSGGVWGYADALKCLKSKKGRSYEELREWYGEDFDPEHFNLQEMKAALDPYNITKKVSARRVWQLDPKAKTARSKE
jgi:hypothetical protein